MSKAARILLAIPVSILFLIIFYGVYILSTLLITLLLWLLSYVPLVNFVIERLLETRGDSYTSFAIIVGNVSGYSTASFVLKRITSSFTCKFSYIFVGSFLVLYNVIFFIINIVAGNLVLGYINLAVSGGYSLYTGIKYDADNDTRLE